VEEVEMTMLLLMLMRMLMSRTCASSMKGQRDPKILKNKEGCRNLE
jgi:hypothetical protein